MRTVKGVDRQSRGDLLSVWPPPADDLAAAIRGQSKAALVRRPDGKNWAATEVICHLRDSEDEFFVRFHVMLSNEDPTIYVDPSAADRVAEDRQYLRSDAGQALGAFT